jgi:cell division protein FtsB
MARLVILLLASSPLAAQVVNPTIQSPKLPVANFPAFGGVTPTQIIHSNVAILAAQVLNELEGVRGETNRGRIPLAAKPELNRLADQAISLCKDLRKLASGHAEIRELRLADAAMERAMRDLASQISRFAVYAPAAAEAMARAQFADQQLDAVLHSGGNLETNLDRVRRQSTFLEQQAETLRDLCGNASDGLPPARQLELTARAFSHAAERFDRAADDASVARQLTDDFTRLLVDWRKFGLALGAVKPPVNLRLQATRVEATMRTLAEIIPAPPGGWDWANSGGIGFLGRGTFVVGAGEGGGPRVRLFANHAGDATFDFFAYDPSFTGGVRVAVADLNGDGVPDLVVAPGPGMPALVRVFDGRTLRLLTEFYAFEPRWTGGVFVAAADRTRDGRSWIAVGADQGAGPHVKVFELSLGKEIDSFFAYDEKFRGGVRVALGDVNGDGTPDVLTAPGPGLEPRVKVFDGRNRAVMGDFLAFDKSYSLGLNIAVADLTKNGRTDLIVGTDAGQPAVVRVFDAVKGTKIGELTPFPRGFRGGVRVSAYDFDANGTPDVACAPGRDTSHPALPIKVFSGVNAKPLGEFFPFGNEFRGGAFIGSR